MTSFYELEALDIKKNPLKFSQYKGKTLLVVNVASNCGYTPQYDGLENLYQKYKNAGFEVLGFPCNQFLGQEPGTEEEIEKFCRNDKHHVTFPLFAKIEVNGESTSPVYQFLKSKLPGDIKWNFEKFLIDGQGNVVKRYLSDVKPDGLEDDVKKYI
ncbi:15095_t:CDS:2 [Entrophospora sp. SA101]|nr:2758_t:CDS:2 [Entrophospora candida]CAH1763706.1 2368_t:CDS:2 [Entrophospora sp. SA101]CAJ0752233.1 15095_t:CDS:2 [Entrophospora sp. SA101]CAJ0835461.1 17156_t:CDS:2 [Entrophospora sp. SA101]CAJ0879048.1 3761_t:CDS:2 [Entrophospora sp. SA101]